MQAMTPDSALAQSRIGLGDLMLQAAQNADNSLATRYSCAFDALYLYALAILGASKDLQSHPYLELLSKGAARLGLSPKAIEPVLERMNQSFGPLEASEEEVFALIELAQEARQRLG